MNPVRWLPFLLVCACSTQLAASTAITGTVTSGSNSIPIPNARVVLKVALPNDRRVQRAQTGPDGIYTISPVDANLTYTLTIESDGLRPFTETNIVLKKDETRHIDAKLSLADVHESVVVTEGVVSLETKGAQISQTLSSTDLTDLPTVTHSVNKDARLDPHVRQAIGLGSDYQDSTRLSINAGSYRNTGYLLDASTNYDWIYSVAPQAVTSQGTVQEMTVMTGQYPAQYGISTTGVLSVTTRSGGDKYHGEAFAFIRPSGIQSKPPLATFHIPNQREDAGGFIGGPIVPGRTFFFASYEGAMQDRGAFIQSPVPGFFDGHATESYGLLRFDHNLNNNKSLTVRLNGNHYGSNNVQDRISAFNQPSVGRLARIQAWGGQASERTAFGGSKVNDLRFAFVDYFPDSAIPLDPSVTVVYPNYATTGYSGYSWVHAQTFNGSDLLIFRHGRHDIKVGGEFVHVRAKDFANTPFGAYTFAPGAHTTGEDPISFSQTFGVQDIRYRANELSAFAQGEIRITPRLTANLGLRYEYQSITDDRNNFAPRLGLAWDATGDGKTMVRAGAGIFYDQYYMYITRRFITLGPKAPTLAYTIPFGSPGFPTFPDSLAAPPAGAEAGLQNIYVPDTKLLNPYALQFSLNVDRQLTRNLVFTVSGMHEHTLKQMRVDDINHPTPFVRTDPNQTRSGADADATRPYTTYDGVGVRDVAVIRNDSSSTYDSLDLALKGKIGSRVQLQGHYVYSSSVTYAMFYADANSGVPNEWWPNWDRYERAPDDFFERHRFVATAVVQLPLKFDFRLVETAGSGLPVNPITGKDDNGDTYKVDRPIGLARNSFLTPAQNSLDIALAKDIRIHESFHAQVLVQAFNVLNHQNYFVVNNVYGEGPQPLSTFLAPQAGVANSDPSRQIEFGLRLMF